MNDIEVTTVSFPTTKKKRRIRVYISWAKIKGSMRPLKQFFTSINPNGYLIFLHNLQKDQRFLKKVSRQAHHNHESEHRKLKSFLGRYS